MDTPLRVLTRYTSLEGRGFLAVRFAVSDSGEEEDTVVFMVNDCEQWRGDIARALKAHKKSAAGGGGTPCGKLSRNNAFD